MRADKVLTVIAAVAATAAIALAAAPSEAQAPPTTATRHHAPARVTVHKRTYLDPGTETKRHTEHSSDYYLSPDHGMDPMRDSALFTNGASLPYFHDRMPMPNCFDLPGSCRE